MVVSGVGVSGRVWERMQGVGVLAGLDQPLFGRGQGVGGLEIGD